jgi:tRNA(Ile2)-agmatinylcytidine synthase
MLTMLIIGIDDTDSERGLCTTYLATVLMDRLCSLGKIKGLPKLVRLNPCVRFKTRGNAAVSFIVETDRPDDVREVSVSTLKELSDFSGPNTNPGLVVAEEIPSELADFYGRAVTEVLEVSDAKEILESCGIWHKGFKNERGLIGALAAVGSYFNDYTYEMIVYREPHRWGTYRYIDDSSVWKADHLTYPSTWDTVDYKNRSIVFAPHSPDPVLFGIRGDDRRAIETASKAIISEPWGRKTIYMTNQGTDAHILECEFSKLADDRSYIVEGVVADEPHVIEGGHIFFTLELSDGNGSIKCAAFEPTKNFRDIIRQLIPDDIIDAYGSVKDGTLNLEKINIIGLAEKSVLAAPICPSCSRRMKSAGRGQGYRCKRCGTKSKDKVEVTVPRDLEPGFYEVPPSARRHLAKPLVRMKGMKVHPSR